MYVRSRADVDDDAALEGLGVVHDGRVVGLHAAVVRQHLLLVVQVLRRGCRSFTCGEGVSQPGGELYDVTGQSIRPVNTTDHQC